MNSTSSSTSFRPQKLRELENSVDKTNMKCKEAEHIQRTYHQIRSKLEDEQTAYGTVLDEAETEIKRWEKPERPSWNERANAVKKLDSFWY